MVGKQLLCSQIYVLVMLVVTSVWAVETSPSRLTPLPDLGRLNFEADVKPFQNQKALICFWDYSQRPSRRFIQKLATQQDQLAQLEIPVLLVQTDIDSGDSSKAWLKTQQINWLSCTLTHHMDDYYREWSVSALPWPVMADANQIQSMGFTWEQLTDAIAAKNFSTLPLHIDWRYTFDTLYRLEHDEVLKHIPTPFDPVRKKYYESRERSDNGQPMPDRLIFRWDSSLIHWGESYGDKGTLKSTLSFVIGLANCEYELSEELLATELHGDWIVRNDIPIPKKLKALESILSQALRRSVGFELRSVEREALVVTGTFVVNPVDKDAKRPRICFYTDPNDDRSRGGGSVESVAGLIREIGNRIEIPVVNKAASSEDQTLGYEIMSSSHFGRINDPIEKRKKVKILLDNISQQTGLTFQFKQSNVDIWFLNEAPTPQ